MGPGGLQTFRKLTATRSKRNRLAPAPAASSPGRTPQPTAVLVPRPVRVPRAGPRCWRPASSRLDRGPVPAELPPALSGQVRRWPGLPAALRKASKGRGEKGVRRRYEQWQQEGQRRSQPAGPVLRADRFHLSSPGLGLPSSVSAPRHRDPWAG